MAQFTAKDVMRKLKSHDRLFEFRAGHGNSHQVVMYHPSINGKPVSCPLPSHTARGTYPITYSEASSARSISPGTSGRASD
jgi:hypothetical protein